MATATLEKPTPPTPPSRHLHDEHTLQRGLLGRFRREGTHLVLLLINGEKIAGTIKNHDQYVIEFRSDDGQLIFLYKHGVIGFIAAEQSSAAEAA
jgi:RNA chaperone Hfq